jgi:DNA-binding transcriptional ArsR family regulator
MSKAPEQGVADVFFALGDRTRLSVVQKLVAGGALSATTLSDGAKVTRQAIVKHLQVLEGAGLVTHEKRGREVLYALDAQRLEQTRAFLDGISAGWDRALARLRRMVEEPQPVASNAEPPNPRRRRS